MPLVVDDYKDKKLAEYLVPGLKALIRFGHGLGDTLMFMPVFDLLKSQYPHTRIDLYVESGQEEIFESYPVRDSEDHDIIFIVHFPMSEGSGVTKQHFCCREEIGIDPPAEPVHRLDQYLSPLVAVHFQGTALPGSVNCPEDKAQIVWNDIIKAGYVPIEVHFEHMFHNPVNAKYNFVTSTVRGATAKVSNLIGLIQNCHAFIGIASGPYVVALATIPDKALLLSNQHKASDYSDNTNDISINDIVPGGIVEWLKST